MKAFAFKSEFVIFANLQCCPVEFIPSIHVDVALQYLLSFSQISSCNSTSQPVYI